MPAKRKSTRKSLRKSNLEVEKVHIEDDGTVESSLKPPTRSNLSVDGQGNTHNGKKKKRSPAPVEPNSATPSGPVVHKLSQPSGVPTRPTTGDTSHVRGRRTPRSERIQSERTTSSSENGNATPAPSKNSVTPASLKSLERNSGEVKRDSKPAATAAAKASRSVPNEAVEDRKPAAISTKPPRSSKPSSRRNSGTELGETSDGADSKVRDEMPEEDGKPKAVVPGAFRVAPGTSTNNNVASQRNDHDKDDEHIPDAEVEVSKSASLPPPATDDPEQRFKSGGHNAALEDRQNQLDGTHNDFSPTNSSAAMETSAGIPIAAELAPDDDEIERRMQERLHKELAKRREQHVVAEAVQIDEEHSLSVGNRSVAGHISMHSVPDRAPTLGPHPVTYLKNRRKLYILVGGVICLVVLVAGVIGGVVANNNNGSEAPPPTMGPTVATTDSYQDMVDTIGSMVASDSSIFYESTDAVQYMAMDWLANSDSWASAEMRDPEELTERYALAVLYFATDGRKWAEQFSFLTDASVCVWNDGTDVWASEISAQDGFGVYCRPDGFVQQIYLQPAAIQGYIPTELGLFSHLAALDLRDSFLDGTLPTEIFSLANLTVLNLRDTEGLTGSIPTEIGLASDLKTLSLGGNRFLGSLPDELFDLTMLEFLDCSLNGLANEISSKIGKLSGKLSHLDLQYNKFNGQIPYEVFSLSQLTYLSFFSNTLSGELSSEIGKLSQLELFDIGMNNLKGSLPWEIGGIPLVELYLEQNDFEGTLPSEWARLTDLKYFQANDNANLRGLVPMDFATLSLIEVSLEGTSLGGIEEAFCAAGKAYDTMWADCGGDSPEVECTCCTVCCIEGQNCEEA